MVFHYGRYPRSTVHCHSGQSGDGPVMVNEDWLLMRQALEIPQRIGATETPDLRAELGALTAPPSAW